MDADFGPVISYAAMSGTGHKAESAFVLSQYDRRSLPQVPSEHLPSGTKGRCSGVCPSGPDIHPGLAFFSRGAKYRLPGFVQKLHFPLRVLFKRAAGGADEIGADFPHLAPGCMPGDLKWIGAAGFGGSLYAAKIAACPRFAITRPRQRRVSTRCCVTSPS
jgi:hypothetical protein